ncbi:MAG TPA: type II toxin-antitoxin system HicA family toxin [Actinomycetota bacterium]|nr:type II toxin-antitoxin system HicA family toxin [Actinomycetota bacterium]
MRPDRLLRRLEDGHVQNVAFSDFVALAGAFGFELDRVRGSHHICRHRSLGIHLNLQEVRGKAKPYQIRQFLTMVERYDLEPEE